jgi:hypothetical protein
MPLLRLWFVAVQSLQPGSGLLEALEDATATLSWVTHHNIISLNSAHQGVASTHRVKGRHSHTLRKMPISAQEWRVRTGLMNASRIRTVSVFRSSKPTVSVSARPANHHDSTPAGFVPPGGGEIVAWNDHPVAVPQRRREGDSCYSALIELPSSTWMGWRAVLLCLLAPLIPKLITVFITICHIFIGGKGTLQFYEAESQVIKYYINFCLYY